MSILFDKLYWAKEQLVLCDYIDNTARMLAEKDRFRAMITSLKARITARQADLDELVG